MTLQTKYKICNSSFIFLVCSVSFCFLTQNIALIQCSFRSWQRVILHADHENSYMFNFYDIKKNHDKVFQHRGNPILQSKQGDHTHTRPKHKAVSLLLLLFFSRFRILTMLQVQQLARIFFRCFYNSSLSNRTLCSVIF